MGMPAPLDGGNGERPNVLFVFGEDWGRCASAYSNLDSGDALCGSVRTPNFDLIAAEGALFANAFTPAPGCNPCRSAVFSGRHFWQTGLGAIEQGTVWDDALPTFPLELEKGGYFLGYSYEGDCGKLGNAPMGGERNAYHSAGRDFGNYSQWVSKMAAPDKLGSIEAAKAALLGEVRGNLTAFLAAWGEARGQGQPFCYCWGPTVTHRDWEPGSGEALWGISPDELKGRLPPFLPDTQAVRQDLADYLGECCALDAGLGELLDELGSRGLLQELLVVATGDHGPPGFPRGKASLYDFGCRVPLAVRWPGRVPPAQLVERLVDIADLAPTICEAAGVPVPPLMSARSLLPTLVGSAPGTTVATPWSTMSWSCPTERVPSDEMLFAGLERHVSIAREDFKPYPQRSLRTERYLYIINFEPARWPAGDPHGLDDPAVEVGEEAAGLLAADTMLAFADMDASPTKAWLVQHRNDSDAYPLFLLAFGKRPQEELYDRQKDPHSMRNLANHPGYASTRGHLRATLLSFLKEQDDPRLTTQPCCFECEPYAGLIEKYQTEKGQAYLAKLAAQRGMWQRLRARL